MLTVRSFRFSAFADRRLRRPIGGLLLACMVALVTGIPLPARSEKTVTEAFPCQDCACGCSTAAQCWDHCCCFSDEEKLQWASEHDVTAPTFLIERVAQAKSRHDRVGSCCKSQPAKRSCCAEQSKPQADAGDEDASDAEATDDGIRVVTIQGLQRCSGIELTMSLLSHAIVVFGQHRIRMPEPRLVDVLLLSDEWTESLSGSIDPPIP